MNALVREAIGFNKDRGDSVNLMNAPFNVAKVETVEVPLWQQPDNIELARSFAWPIAMVVLGLVVLLGFVRPSLKMMRPPSPEEAAAQAAATAAARGEGTQLEALVDGSPERPGLLPGLAAPDTPHAPTEYELQLEDAKRLAKENPVAVANIVKGWVNGEAPA